MSCGQGLGGVGEQQHPITAGRETLGTDQLSGRSLSVLKEKLCQPGQEGDSLFSFGGAGKGGEKVPGAVVNLLETCGISGP